MTTQQTQTDSKCMMRRYTRLLLFLELNAPHWLIDQEARRIVG